MIISKLSVYFASTFSCISRIKRRYRRRTLTGIRDEVVIPS